MKKLLFLLIFFIIITDSFAGKPLYRVKNVGEFMEAIGSDRVIELQPGMYNLTQAQGTEHPDVKWVESHDGFEPVISNIDNMTISTNGYAEILIDPNYVYVMHFDKCSNISIKNITLGHTDKGYCIGGVLKFNDSKNIKIEKSILFGSGTYGITLERTQNFEMKESEIKECTYGLLQIYNCSDISFRNTSFHHTGEFDLVECNYVKNIVFEKCSFLENNGYVLFKVVKSPLIIKDSVVSDNKISKFSNDPDTLTLSNVDFRYNAFPSPVKRFGICTGSNVNVREGKGFDFPVVLKLQKGEKIEIVSMDRPSGKRLAVLSGDTKVKAGRHKVRLGKGKALTVTGKDGELYTAEVTVNKKRQIIKIHESKVIFISGFMKIKTKNNKTGWIVSKFIKEEK